jgi:hypothetical protein
MDNIHCHTTTLPSYQVHLQMIDGGANLSLEHPEDVHFVFDGETSMTMINQLSRKSAVIIPQIERLFSDLEVIEVRTENTLRRYL